MYVRQIFDAYPCGSYLGGVDPKIFDGCMSIKYFGGSTPPKYLTDVCPSNIWGVYTPKIFDGCMSVKYLTRGVSYLGV